MPALPTYASRIPHALDILRDTADDIVSRRQVEELLCVKKRTANDIISAAGAVEVGNSNCVTRENLILYLEHFGFGGPAERERQKTFACKLNRLREEFLTTPRLMVDLEKVDPKSVARASRRGLGGLPEGVVLERGRITIQGFRTGEEAIQKLSLFAMAVASDFEEFEEKVEVVKVRTA
jgi:hypothetical protein